MKQAVGTRTQLLAASVGVMRAEGLVGLTLDAVARRAGVSKGGLLYHFPTKAALIEALLRQLLADFDARVTHLFEREPDGPGRWLRAYVRATFEDDPPPLELIAILLGGLAEDEMLLALIRDDAESWQRRLADERLAPARVTIIRRATDAAWLERALHAPVETTAMRHAVLQELLDLIEEGAR